MLTNLIENRGKEFSNLIKIGDYLARTLRENVEMFGVEDGVVTYLTETGNVISGKYSFKPVLKLTNIQVEDASVLEDKKVYESSVDKKVSEVLFSLLEDDYQEAEGSFDKILSLFEAKMSYERIKNRLEEKVQRFGEQTSVVTSKEFGRLFEMKDQLVEFLIENRDTVQTPGIQNGMKLAALVSTSFELPRMSTEQLQESKVFEVCPKGKVDLYEYLCRKELVQKEIMEAKQGFEKIWIDNEQVHELASMVFESDEEAIRHQVAQTITEVPYFALATKKQISEILRNALSMNETTVKSKDLNMFASDVYRMKKPVKGFVIDTLNEKYGIDIKKLTDIPTFRSLALTEAELLIALAKKTPEGSVLEKTLLELASILPAKDGAETIDLATFLSEMFAAADYTESLNENSLMNYMDFSKVAEDLGKIGDVLKMLSPKLQDLADGEMDMEGEGGEEEADLGSEDPMDSGSEAEPKMDAEEAAAEVQDEEAAAAEGMEGAEEEAEEEEEDETPEGDVEPDEESKTQEEVMDALNQLEDLLSGILKDDDEEDDDKDPEQFKS
tara:strand:- start:250 stop:1917 length:1668 start_codon:yes stop_codon:yes gene_type:complete